MNPRKKRLYRIKRRAARLFAELRPTLTYSPEMVQRKMGWLWKYRPNQ